MSLGSLTVDLAANITRFEKALTKAERMAEKKTKGIQRTFTRLAGGVGAALVGAGLIKAADSALDFVDAIEKAADRAGIGAEKLQELRFAADQMGISTQQLDDGMRRFTRRLGVALEGGSFAKDFANLGVSIRDASGDARSSEDVFDDVARAMKKVETQAQRSAAAAQLFGDDTGPQLSLLMKDGLVALDAFAERAHSMGLVIEEDLIKRGVDAKDELSVLSQVIKTKLVVALVNAAPAIEAAATAFIGLTESASKFFGGIEALSAGQVVSEIESIMDSIIDAKSRLAETLEREESRALKDVLMDQFLPSSESIDEEIIRLEAKLLEAQLRLGELNLSRMGGDEGDKKGFISGLTNDEIDGELAYIEGVLERAAKAHEKLAKDRLKTQQFVDSQVKSSEQSIASNSISLLQTLGRERKGFALAAIALQKGLAIAEASMNTAVAYTKALTIDPTGALAARVAMLGKIQIGLIAATGIAQAASISAGGGGAGESSAPLGSEQNPITTTSQDVLPADGGTSGTITINVNGVVTDEIMQDLIIPAIQDATNDKDVILFRPESRQAIELGVS